jgi:hypothetical protein
VHLCGRLWQADAVVTAVLAGSNFRVALVEGGHELIARPAF